MENLAAIAVPLVLLGVTVRLLYVPMKWGVRLLVNGLGGVLCLWLVNLISGFTGLAIPVNPVTVLIAGFLGLPGLALLALAQIVL